MKNDREYRFFDFTAEERSAENGETEMIVEGYASTFDEYVVFTENGIDYKEQIDEKAFDDCDFSDCVFRIDHTGPVYARTSNGTVAIDVDEKGLLQKTDLSKTERARQIYEDIKAGNYPKMSFAFTVADDEYREKEHKRTILKIDKVFDVSPVTWPANPNTFISARDSFNGAIERERAERREAERKKEERARRDALIRKILVNKLEVRK